MRIGILTGGGDVPGLNAAIKAVVNRAAEQGHEVLGLKRGWAGLLYVDPLVPGIAGRVLPADGPGLGAHDRPFGAAPSSTARGPTRAR